jgi:hypothetical protein
LLFHSGGSPRDFDRLRSGPLHGFAAEIIGGSKAPGIIHQHAYADAHGIGAAGVSNPAILGSQRALAMVDNADVGITGPALRGRVQRPISNLFHAHSKLR